MDRFDLADDVEDIVELYTSSAKAFFKNNDQEKYNAAYDQFTVLVEDLYEDKGQELKRRDEEGESKSKRHTIEREKRVKRGEHKSRPIAFNPKNREDWATSSSPPVPRLQLPVASATFIASSPAKIPSKTEVPASPSPPRPTSAPEEPQVEKLAAPAQVEPVAPSPSPLLSPPEETEMKRTPEKAAVKKTHLLVKAHSESHPIKSSQSQPLSVNSKNPIVDKSEPILIRCASEKSPSLAESVTRKRTTETTVAPPTTAALQGSSPQKVTSSLSRRRMTRDLSLPKEIRSDGNQVVRMSRTNSRTQADFTPPESAERTRFHTVGVDSSSRERALRAVMRIQAESEMHSKTTDNSPNTSQPSPRLAKVEGKTISLRTRKLRTRPENAKSEPPVPKPDQSLTKPTPTPAPATQRDFAPLDQELFQEESQKFQNLLLSRTKEFSTTREFDLNTNFNLLDKQLEVLKLAKDNLSCRVQRQSHQLESVGFLLSHARTQLQALGVNV